MPIHAALAIIVQLLAAAFDLSSRRIPNRLLLGAICSHLLLVISTSDFPPVRLGHLLLVAGISILILHPRPRRWLQRYIGMGDLKLLLYLAIFFLPFVHLNVWMSAISLVCMMILFGRPSTMKSSLPLAPIILAASLLSLVHAAQLAAALEIGMGEFSNALVNFR